MPLHNLECSSGHIFEHFISLAELKNYKIKCKSKFNCKSFAKIVYLSPRQSRNALAFEPSLLFVNSNGDVIAPGRNNTKHLPKKYLNDIKSKGYKEVKIETFRQYEQFRREQTLKAKAQHLEQSYHEKEAINDILQNNINEVLYTGYYHTRNDGSKVFIPPIDKLDNSEAKKLAQRAVDECRSLMNKNEENFDPNIHIDSFENDNPKWNDKETGFRDRWV